MQASISHARQDGTTTFGDARIGIYSFRRLKRQWMYSGSGGERARAAGRRRALLDRPRRRRPPAWRTTRFPRQRRLGFLLGLLADAQQHRRLRRRFDFVSLEAIDFDPLRALRHAAVALALGAGSVTLDRVADVGMRSLSVCRMARYTWPPLTTLSPLPTARGKSGRRGSVRSGRYAWQRRPGCLSRVRGRAAEIASRTSGSNASAPVNGGAKVGQRGGEILGQARRWRRPPNARARRSRGVCGRRDRKRAMRSPAIASL